MAKGMSDLFSLQNRTVIITGGTGFLGRHFAEVVSRAGGNAVIADLDENACKAVASALKKEYKTNPLGVGLDLRNESSVETAIRTILKAYGRVDVLVNNAALRTKNFYASFPDVPLDEWKEVVDVNLTGMFLMARGVIPSMAKARSGSIINVASIYGVVGPSQEIYEGSPIILPAVYSASKGGVVMFTKWLATTYGKDNIRSNALCPGGVSEKQDFGGKSFEMKYSEKVPLGRMAKRSDLTGPLLLLASDAGAYMNGHILVVDSGWTSR